MEQKVPLLHGNYYHIYNRGNNSIDVFLETENYLYFLRLYAKYIEPVADTYAWCLLKNHFHILVRIKDRTEINESELSYTTTENQKLLNRQDSSLICLMHTLRPSTKNINEQEVCLKKI